jgi:hypothetical protein
MHYLVSDTTEETINYFPVFCADIILNVIKKHLLGHPDDTLSFERDLTSEEAKKYAGRHIIDFYRLNRKGDVCKVIMKGDKEYLKRVNIPENTVLGQETWEDDPEGAYHATYG